MKPKYLITLIRHYFSSGRFMWQLLTLKYEVFITRLLDHGWYGLTPLSKRTLCVLCA